MKTTIERQFEKYIPEWITKFHNVYAKDESLKEECYRKLSRFNYCVVGDMRKKLGLSTHYEGGNDDYCLSCENLAIEFHMNYKLLQTYSVNNAGFKSSYRKSLKDFAEHLKKDHAVTLE